MKETEKFDTSKCRKCGGEMKVGDYIAETHRDGTPDFIDSKEVVTISAGGPGKLCKNACMKCSTCGWSVR